MFSIVFDFIGSTFGYVLWYFFDLFDNYSLAIVCFTILIKVLLFPLDLKSRIAAFKSNRLVSKQFEIKKMYKGDPKKQAEAIDDLYSREGVNAGTGGSFAQIIFQFVFMIGIFRAIVKPLSNLFHINSVTVKSAVEKVQSLSGTGINLLKGYEELNVVRCAPLKQDVFNMFNSAEMSDILDFNKGFNFFGLDFSLTPREFSIFNVVWLFPLFGVLTSLLVGFISQKINKQKGMPGCMKLAPYIAILPAVFFTINMPIAVGFYNIVSNILMIIQTLIIAKFFNPVDFVAKEEAARIERLLIEEKRVLRK